MDGTHPMWLLDCPGLSLKQDHRESWAAGSQRMDSAACVMLRLTKVTPLGCQFCKLAWGEDSAGGRMSPGAESWNRLKKGCCSVAPAFTLEESSSSSGLQGLLLA